MAGKSSRFRNEGFVLPKYELEIKGIPLFRLSILSFENYFTTELFLFVLNHSSDSQEFVEREIKKLRIKNYQIIILENDTKGQADTVAQAIQNLYVHQSEYILIFNIDTIRPGFEYPVHFPNFPWIETFYSKNGDNWSFVIPYPNSDEVYSVREKQRVSNYCSTGMYFFPSIEMYLDVYSLQNKKRIDTELYVAPLYQLLIDRKIKVKYTKVDNNQVFFAGTPSEFRSLNFDELHKRLNL